MADATIGDIKIWSGTWVPRNWLPCDGRTVTVQQYQALFSLIAFTYGGDHQANFALPDLRSRVPRGVGTGPNLHAVTLGQLAGAEANTVTGTINGQVTLNTTNIPPHNHTATFSGTPVSSTFNSTLAVSTNPGAINATAGGILSQGSAAGTGQAAIFQPTPGGPTVALAGGAGSVSVTATGNVTVNNSTGTGAPAPVTGNIVAAPVNVLDPYLGINYIICVNGLYPDRP